MQRLLLRPKLCALELELEQLMVLLLRSTQILQVNYDDVRYNLLHRSAILLHRTCGGGC